MSCRKNGVEYSVVKNTLVRRAIDQVGMSELDSILNGTTSLAISKEDPIAPMRIINKYAKQMGDRFNIKAGFMEGQGPAPGGYRRPGRAAFQGRLWWLSCSA